MFSFDAANLLCRGVSRLQVSKLWAQGRASFHSDPVEWFPLLWEWLQWDMRSTGAVCDTELLCNAVTMDSVSAVQEWCFSSVLCYRSDLFGWCEKGAIGCSFPGHESGVYTLSMQELPDSLYWTDSSVMCRLVTKLFDFWNYSWLCDCFHLLRWLWLC